MTVRSLAALGIENLYPVRLGMRHRFRGVDHREVILLRGSVGWGEFSPFAEYPPAVTVRWLAAALESANTNPPPIRRSHIPVNVTVPAVDSETAYRIVSESGATTAKVKVAEPGQTESDDLDRLAGVRRALGDGGKIRIDANGAWNPETAIARLKRLESFDLEYVEQPVADLEGMVRVREMVSVPVAADESVRLADDPLEVVEAGGADILVMKVQPMGGIARVLDVAAQSGLPVVISSALETSVGIASGLLAAAALKDLPFACGLGTVSLLAEDVVSEPLKPLDGELAVSRPVPEPELLERLRPAEPVCRAMLDRFWAAAGLLS